MNKIFQGEIPGFGDVKDMYVHFKKCDDDYSKARADDSNWIDHWVYEDDHWEKYDTRPLLPLVVAPTLYQALIQ